MTQEEAGEDEAEEYENRGTEKRRGGKILTDEVQPEHEKEYSSTHHHGTRNIHMAAGKNLCILKEDHRQHHQSYADRHVDVEDVAPRIPTHDPSAQVWSDDASHIEDTAEKSYDRLPAFGKMVARHP